MHGRCLMTAPHPTGGKLTQQAKFHALLKQRAPLSRRRIWLMYHLGEGPPVG